MASAINTGFELDAQKLSQAGIFTSKSYSYNSPAIDDNRVRIPARLDVTSINATNRRQEALVRWIAAFTMFLVIASIVVTILWLLSAIGAELATWEFGDLVRGIGGSNWRS